MAKKAPKSWLQSQLSTQPMFFAGLAYQSNIFWDAVFSFTWLLSTQFWLCGQ